MAEHDDVYPFTLAEQEIGDLRVENASLRIALGLAEELAEVVEAWRDWKRVTSFSMNEVDAALTAFRAAWPAKDKA